LTDLASIEHQPWVGDCYDAGVNGSKLLLVGFSHHGLPDHSNFTQEVVCRWACSAEAIPFASRIRTYFKSEDAHQFWHSVAFANALGSSVGSSDSRYSKGTRIQRDSVSNRITVIINQLKPDKVIVFSRAAWQLFPPFNGDIAENILSEEDLFEIEFGSYSHPDGIALAFGLAHPQYASTVAMIASIRAILSL
jgi:hypothetical protein